MKEDVLQYIWKTQSFDKSNISTTKGERVTILAQGVQNTNAGPDFTNGRLLINDIEWIGDIEIHTTTSQWVAHKHDLDPSYNKVILHVVWEHNKEILRADGSEVPTIELKNLVQDIWLERYRMLASSLQEIPCQAFIKEVDRVYFANAFSRVLLERLKRKSGLFLDVLEQAGNDWNKASYQFLIRNFGFKKNGDAFSRLSLLVEYEVCKKLDTQLQIEAYLFGMAGLIPTHAQDKYSLKLTREFAYLRRKYDLKSEPMQHIEWRFMRMRPANFPTLRIAQLASFLYSNRNFFRKLIELPVNAAPDFFRVSPSEYWHSHYHFNRETTQKLSGLGKQSSVVLSTNVAAVLLMAYGLQLTNDSFIDKAMAFLEKLPSENNSIISLWRSLDIAITNSAESQAAIELFNNYCKKAGCLSCSVGNKILKHG
jgi:hypothetical protein